MMEINMSVDVTTLRCAARHISTVYYTNNIILSQISSYTTNCLQIASIAEHQPLTHVQLELNRSKNTFDRIRGNPYMG